MAILCKSAPAEVRPGEAVTTLPCDPLQPFRVSRRPLRPLRAFTSSPGRYDPCEALPRVGRYDPCEPSPRADRYDPCEPSLRVGRYDPCEPLPRAGRYDLVSRYPESAVTTQLASLHPEPAVTTRVIFDRNLCVFYRPVRVDSLIKGNRRHGSSNQKRRRCPSHRSACVLEVGRGRGRP